MKPSERMWKMADNDNVTMNVTNEEHTTRKSPDIKFKLVQFTLTKEMRLADLVSEGYQRKEVEQLFVELQDSGLGIFQKGKLGRGQSGKFIGNDDLAGTIIIKTQVRRLRNNYFGKPIQVAETVQPIAVIETPSVVMPAEDSWVTNQDIHASEVQTDSNDESSHQHENIDDIESMGDIDDVDTNP